MSVSLIIILSWLEGITVHIATHTQTAGVLTETNNHTVSSRGLLSSLSGPLPDLQCEMLLCLNILVLLLLQPALSLPLTTPSRGCPTCKSKSTESQPSVDTNTTSLAVGEPCGVYTLSCAQGLRCAPQEDEPRPLRALLEGRGVCTNGSSIGPTETVQTAGKSPTLCLKMMFMLCWFLKLILIVTLFVSFWQFHLRTAYIKSTNECWSVFP